MDKYTIDHAIAFYRDIPTGQYDDEAVTALEFFRDHQWQPIETAPKDDSWFMVCICHDGECRYVGGKPLIVFWDGANLVTQSGKELNGKGYYSPTHWMPLPEPPR